MKRIGKQGNAWLRTRREWFKANPPDYRGFWACGLCGQPVDKYGDLDHIQPRGSHPELRHELSNLRILHRICHQTR